MSSTGVSLAAVRELARREGLTRPAKFPMQKPEKKPASKLLINLMKANHAQN